MQTQMLRDSFALVKPHGSDLTGLFYKLLFERYPQVRPLFSKVDLAEQRKKLLAALALVVANADKPAVLAPVLAEMGARHVGYGAEEGHYPAVGECLLAALAQIAGPAWTPDLEAAWAEAYGAVTQLMLAPVAISS